MNPKDLIIQPPFSSVGSIGPMILECIQENMAEFGFDQAHPIVIWKEKKIVLDGHTRRQAAMLCGIENVPVVEHSFPGELEVLEYMRHHQEFRRQNDDGMILRMVELIDQRKKAFRGNQHTSGKASSEAQAPGKSAAETAGKIGTSRAKVEKARVVIARADEQTKQAVLSGQKSINAAAKEAKEKKPETPKTFNQTNDNIEWAKWSWNPVTGCKYGCDYCYARDIGVRFNGDFEPKFYPDRLAAPENTKVPVSNVPGSNNVFVCSMADLFGEWVPDEWIDKVLESVRANPQWTFIFLTKNPARMVDIDWPRNAWVGTTIDRQSRVAEAEGAFSRIMATVKFVSMEPMLEPISFAQIAVFDWVIIGGRSKNTGGAEFQPEWSWVESVLNQARAEKLKVYFKPNLKSRPQEYPQDAGK